MELVGQADALREEFLKARERDEAAFDRVVAATAMPKATESQKHARRAALELSLAHAAAEPLAAAQNSLEVLHPQHKPDQRHRLRRRVRARCAGCMRL